MNVFKNTLVVIPARGGSKRIPKKNVLIIHGQPMLFWPLEAISSIVKSENIIVSTDCDEIKNLVETTGLRIPFKRPSNLSDDFTGTVEVTKHALGWFEANIRRVDYVLTIYPTAVLLRTIDIIEAMDMLEEDENTDTVMSATTFPFPIQRAIYQNSAGYAQMFEPDNYHRRSQDFTEAFHDAGQFYLSRAEAVRNGTTINNSNFKIKLLNRQMVIDIDTLEDLSVAEEKLKLYKNRKPLCDWRFS